VGGTGRWYVGVATIPHKKYMSDGVSLLMIDVGRRKLVASIAMPVTIASGCLGQSPSAVLVKINNKSSNRKRTNISIDSNGEQIWSASTVAPPNEVSEIDGTFKYSREKLPIIISAEINSISAENKLESSDIGEDSELSGIDIIIQSSTNIQIRPLIRE
jgi:hypothetical protein